MTRNTDPKVVFLTHSISENSQTCPRHLPRPGRQASTRMNRLFLKLKVSPQLWDEQTSREQQTLAVPPEKPRKQASSKTKCTAITVKKKKEVNFQQSTCKRILFSSFILQNREDRAFASREGSTSLKSHACPVSKEGG